MPKKRVKAIRQPQRAERMEADGTMTIFVPGGQQPYCRVKPSWSLEAGPHLRIYKCSMYHPDDRSKDDLVLTLHSGGMKALAHWLPVLINSAQRLANRHSRSKRLDREIVKLLDSND